MSIVFYVLIYYFLIGGCSLENLILETIKKRNNKMISYEEYMNLALYDPVEGYYMKDKKKLGQEGDFYTSSGVHAVFGKAFAHLFLDIIEKEALPPKICEFGGGDGRFAQAVLDEWRKIAPNGKEVLSYIIIEMSPYHREEQKKRLDDFEGFRQFATLDAYQKYDHNDFEGIIFSNELIDALPVHVIEKNGENLYEVFISVDDFDQLVERKVPCLNNDIVYWLEKYGPSLVDGQRIEVPLSMNTWIDEVTRFLKRGLLLTIDYGYSKEEWAMPARKDGSLRGYYKHQMITDPLLYSTDMDLTSHIHLDAYRQLLNEANLKEIIDEKQHRFLLMIGILKFLQENYDPNPFSEKSKQNRAVRSLVSDNGMSAAFQVFLHGKQLSNIESYRFLAEDPYNL